MKHSIFIEADSYADLKAQVRELAHQHGILQGGAAVTEAIAEAVADKPEKKSTSKPAPEKKKKAEPAEEAVAAPAEEAVAAPAEEVVIEEVAEEKAADKPAVKVDLDKCRAQVMAYVKENGQVKGKELIESFGATKLSDVPADRLTDLFVAAGGAL